MFFKKLIVRNLFLRLFLVSEVHRIKRTLEIKEAEREICNVK